MPTQIKSKRGLKKAYEACTQEVRWYFEHISTLLETEGLPMDVCLAYVFARLELGQNMALYCGVVKIHKVHADVAKSVVSTLHMKREGFIKLYKTVFDSDLPSVALTDLKSAEKTRDQVMHGKTPTVDTIRNAIARVLEYSQAVNKQIGSKHGLKPFGRLQGYAGRAQRLDKRTSRYLLKGMGFEIA